MSLKLASVLPIATLLSATLGSDVRLQGAEQPVVSPSHRAFLSRVARRTVRDAFGKQLTYKADYVPGPLTSLSVEVVVRLRQRGFLLASGVGGPGPITVATRDAALAASRIAAEHRDAYADQLDDLLIEIEVVGPAEPVSVDVDWTRPRALDAYIEPGIHGMILEGPRSRHRFCPSELVTSDMVLADALDGLAKRTLSDPSKITRTKLMRFRTAHWYQSAPGAEIVSLHRGLTVIQPHDVSARTLDDVIARLADYMAYRQLPSGLFTYQYEPSHDAYSEENNLVRQVGAVAAMALHGAWSGQSATTAAAALGIEYHLQGFVEIPNVKQAAYIATANKKNKLGVTALLAIAMADHADAKRYADKREQLINGMLWLQRPSGMFITAFPPAEEIGSQDYFPGEALLAMAKQYQIRPAMPIVEAFDRAIAFYREYFRGAPSPAFVPWQVQAFSIMARHGKRKDYVDYVFELTDWLAAKQLNASNCSWPEMWGGIASYQPGRAGVATASYLEGMADALTLARDFGDAKRARRYERVVREAARFVMQLQVRPEEAYFVRSPRDAVGGIRATPALNLLRIDHCQHALVGLIKARQALYPERD